MGDMAVSFVHGYKDPSRKIDFRSLPALWKISEDREDVLSFPFPRTPKEFTYLGELVLGELPSDGSVEFPGKARFGFRGMARVRDKLFCATFSSVHVLDVDSLELQSIVTNRLTNDLHGIAADEEFVYFVLPGRDLFVRMTHDGDISKTWTIRDTLEVVVDELIPQVDWRFEVKQKEGPYGKFHFNFVRRHGTEFWLTARNLGAVVALDIENDVARLVTFAHNTPVMLHDGVLSDGIVFFTSVDGKIIPVDPSGENKFARWELNSVELDLYERGLTAGVQRISESDFGREPNWCRGIEIVDDVRWVTVDGRIGRELSFGLLGLSPEGRVVGYRKIPWERVGDIDGLRYVTGFDVLSLTAE